MELADTTMGILVNLNHIFVNLERHTETQLNLHCHFTEVLGLVVLVA